MPRLARSAPLVFLVLASCTGESGESSGPQTEGSSSGPGPVASTSGSASASDSTSAGSTSAPTSATSATGTTGETETSTLDGSAGDTASATTDGTGDTEVDDVNALYVSEAGQDSNPGTAAEPMRTIQWALNAAADDPDVEQIRVAEGSYEADVANDTTMVLLDGVSLYGGWSPDFGDRDPQLWPSVLVDSSNQTPAATQEGNPARVVEIPPGVGATTVFDGFRLEVGQGQYATALYIGGDAIVSGNEFVRGTTSPSTVAYAVFIEGGSPQLLGNRVDLDYGDGIDSVHALRMNSGMPVLANNVITATGGSVSRYALWLTNTTPTILGNSVHMDDRILFYVHGDSAPRIENNLLQSGGPCIYSLSPGAVPSSVRNNLLQCSYTVFASGSSPLSSWTTIAELHAGMPGVASGNVQLGDAPVDPADDLQLDDTVPCTVTRGGLDLSAEHPQDFYGTSRTDPLSIGAHEWDGDCL